MSSGSERVQQWLNDNPDIGATIARRFDEAGDESSVVTLSSGVRVAKDLIQESDVVFDIWAEGHLPKASEQE
jgi:hypothetical protein